MSLSPPRGPRVVNLVGWVTVVPSMRRLTEGRGTLGPTNNQRSKRVSNSALFSAKSICELHQPDHNGMAPDVSHLFHTHPNRSPISATLFSRKHCRPRNCGKTRKRSAHGPDELGTPEPETLPFLSGLGKTISEEACDDRIDNIELRFLLCSHRLCICHHHFRKRRRSGVRRFFLRYGSWNPRSR